MLTASVFQNVDQMTLLVLILPIYFSVILPEYCSSYLTPAAKFDTCSQINPKLSLTNRGI